jgi:transposase-like protein
MLIKYIFYYICLVMLGFCPKCGSDLMVKSGYVASRQRYMCKKCGYYFSVNNRGKAQHVKRHAIHLYLEGKGFRSIGRLLGVSNVTVLKWVRNMFGDVPKIRNDYRHVDKIGYKQVGDFVLSRKDKVGKGWLLIGIDENNPVTCWVTDEKEIK